jgi:hypothetical protein
MRRSLNGRRVLWFLLATAVLPAACKATSSSQYARVADASDGPESTGTRDALTSADAGSDPPARAGTDGSIDRGGTSVANDAAPGSDSGTPNSEATQVCRAAITALVERAEFCFGYDIDYARHLDACPDYYFNADSNRTVAAVTDCIPQVKSQPCSELELNLTVACLQGGKRPGGAGCLFPSQCEGNICESGLNGCGTCRDGNFPPGATCQRFQCQPGDFCDESADKCVSGSTLVDVAEGESCANSKTSTVICQGDLHCTNVGTTTMMTCQSQQRFNCGSRQCDASSYCKDLSSGTCAAFAKLGEACNETGLGDVPRCDPSFRCWNGKCAKRRLAGESCDADQPCSEFYDCASGTCRLRVCPA